MRIESFRKILVCVRYGIGDLIMELPVLKALRETAVKARIDIVGAKPAVDILVGCGFADRIISIQEFHLQHWFDYGTPSTKQKIYNWLTSSDYDLILDSMHAVAAIGEVIWNLDIPRWEANQSEQSLALQKKFCGVRAIRDGIIRGWKINVPKNVTPILPIGAPVRDEANLIVSRCNLLGTTRVGISPGAATHLKQWPEERYAEIVDRITENKMHIALVFCGSDFDGEGFRQKVRYPESVFIFQQLNLQIVAALLSVCKCFVGNDTGLMHLAGAVGTPVCGIFGPTVSSIYLPRTPHSVAAETIYKCQYKKHSNFGPPGCVVEGKCKAGLRSCIDSVRIQDVWDRIRSII